MVVIIIIIGVVVIVVVTLCCAKAILYFQSLLSHKTRRSDITMLLLMLSVFPTSQVGIAAILVFLVVWKWKIQKLVGLQWSDIRRKLSDTSHGLEV